MRNLYLTAITILLLQCSSSPKKNKDETLDSMNQIELNQAEHENGAEATAIDEAKDEENETAFIVVLDTSDQFNKMFDLALRTSKKFNIQFDTFQKTYFSETNLWGVSMSSEDVMYSGEYFPRRHGDEKEILSLEYQNWYDHSSRDKNLMLVANIFHFSMDAEESVARWRPFFPNAFILQSEIYMGCMH